MEKGGGFPCPSCGYRLAPGTPTCGNCGTQTAAALGAQTIAAPSVGRRLGVRLVFLGLVATGIYAAAGPIRDVVEGIFDDVSGAVQRLEEEGSDPLPTEVQTQSPRRELEGSYRGVRAIADAIDRGGLRCRQVQIDNSDAYTETGSCQASGRHVQINLYFTPATRAGAMSFFEDFAFPSVHAENWWVVSDMETARRVWQILGGRLIKPSTG
ncbi:MAG: zinc ribbon domain-containing protein [Actinomycetota bacterium]